MSVATSNRWALLVPVAIAVGCSSGAVTPQRAANDGKSAVTRVPSLDRPAAEGRRPFRPIPDVIAKRKPFRTDAPREALIAMPAARPATVAPPRLARLPAADASNPTVTEVRDMIRTYLRAFNRHDAAALAAHWSETGENLDLDSGEVTASGRAEVRDVFATLFSVDDEATIDIDVHSIRPIRDDVAIVDGVSLISFADGAPASSRFSAVVVREHGRWVLENVREAAAPTPATGARRPLDELEWLVGSWEDDGAGVAASTRCDWSPGRGFLVRSHLITPVTTPLPPAGDDHLPALLPAADAKPREITEVIGWDPDRGSIRSWIFSGDGRFAEGTWERDGGRWTIRLEGRGRDEGAVASCTLEQATEDGIAVHCDAGRLAPLLPPACGFSRTAR